MGRPHGLVVKLGVLHFGSPGSVPRHGHTPFISSHAVAGTHIQNRGRLGGWPGGIAVKFMHSTLAAQDSLVWILGADMAPLGKPCCGRRPTYKNIEEDGHRC